MIQLVSSLKQYRHDGKRWHFVFPKKEKRRGQCKVIHCARKARVEVRPKKKGFRVSVRRACPTCECRLYRANNPARDVYRQIKDRALRRHQIFKLTFAEFLEAIAGTEYLTRRGTGINELHLDRIRVAEGYVPGNLQVITAEENLRKQREVDYCHGPF